MELPWPPRLEEIEETGERDDVPDMACMKLCCAAVGLETDAAEDAERVVEAEASGVAVIA
jgi:hypothetical protein